MFTRILEKITFLTLFLSFSIYDSRASPIQFDGAPMFIKEKLSFFYDERDELSFDEVKKQVFLQSPPSGGFFSGSYWAKGNICFSKKGNYVFLHKDLVEGLEIFYGNPISLKFRHHLPSRFDKMEHFWVQHQLPYVESSMCETYYFRFFSNDVLNFQIKLISVSDLRSEESNYSFLYAVYYAFLILILCLAVTFLIKTRSMTYLMFIALIMTQDILGTTMLNGFLTKNIVDPGTMLRYDLGNIFALYMNISLVLFPIFFLNIKNKIIVAISTVLAAIQFIGSIPLLINFLVPVYTKYWWFSEFVNTSILICCYWSFAIGIFKCKIFLGKLYVLGTGIKILSQVVKTLLLQGDLAENMPLLTFGFDASFFLFNITAFGAISEATVIVGSMVIQYFHSIEEMSERVKEAEKYQAIAEATQMLAHDIKKPFANLRLSLDNIQRIKDSEKLNKFLMLMKDDVDKKLSFADKMTTEILEFGKPLRTDRTSENLGTIVRAGLLSAANYLHRRGIKIEILIPSDLTVKVDSVSVLRVFENLFVNAFQHMEDGHKLTVRASAEKRGRSVNIIVLNTGSSISPEEMGIIFKPFYTKGKKDGTGLGLSICRKILLEHGEDIRCESFSNSVKFHLSLPLSQYVINSKIVWPKKIEAFITKNSLPDTQINSDELYEYLDTFDRSLKIAVIEDEKIYREGLIDLLETRFDDYVEFEQFSTAEDFLLCRRTGNFDLIIADNDFPEGISGSQLINQLKLEGNIAVLCLHSNTCDGTGSGIVPKPMSRRQLYSLIFEAIKLEKSIIV